ncbi:M16 family metallopeptidase [Bryobacter aggregatus]|uniref:M16 family metallopeptidase n=1 Tax=Bryobacter aggregatus TaxID=360054 RepID=UPI0009B5BB27|nr:pitrilysin family protein [Bryobacter aggregatus]
MKRLSLALAVLLPAAMWGQKLADIEKRVTEFQLANGVTFVIYERHQAPVVSFFSRINAGGADDPKGQAGLAHMFEHMAFKGTTTIGSLNFPQEKLAMAQVEVAYDALSAERGKGRQADAAKVKTLEENLKKAIEKAGTFVDKERFTKILEENGAVGLNAFTSLDETAYIMSMPANKLELWFALESDRFINPVFREFYNERGVIREEYRMRIESDPTGRLINEMLSVAFATSPYRTGPAGIPSDIESYRLADALAFRKIYYVPSNLVIAIAGDVDPVEVKRLAEKYFGKFVGGPKPTRPATQETPQQGEKRLVVESPSQPVVAIGYKRPSVLDPDDTKFDVLSSLLSSGRTSVMYKELVQDKKIALAAQAIANFPGAKLENLFVLFLVPNAGKTTEDCEKAAYEIVERMKTQPVTEEQLKRVKTQIRANLIRGLDSNSGMAQNMATTKALFGDWRVLFTQLDELDKVTAADVMAAAKKYLVAKNRTVGSTVQPVQAKEEQKK